MQIIKRKTIAIIAILIVATAVTGIGAVTKNPETQHKVLETAYGGKNLTLDLKRSI